VTQVNYRVILRLTINLKISDLVISLEVTSQNTTNKRHYIIIIDNIKCIYFVKSRYTALGFI